MYINCYHWLQIRRWLYPSFLSSLSRKCNHVATTITVEGDVFWWKETERSTKSQTVILYELDPPVNKNHFRFHTFNYPYTDCCGQKCYHHHYVQKVYAAGVKLSCNLVCTMPRQAWRSLNSSYSENMVACKNTWISLVYNRKQKKLEIFDITKDGLSRMQHTTGHKDLIQIILAKKWKTLEKTRELTCLIVFFRCISAANSSLRLLFRLPSSTYTLESSKEACANFLKRSPSFHKSDPCK